VWAGKFSQPLVIPMTSLESSFFLPKNKRNWSMPGAKTDFLPFCHPERIEGSLNLLRAVCPEIARDPSLRSGMTTMKNIA